MLRDIRGRMQTAHAALKAAGIKLNIARGKPAAEQMALANRLLTAVSRAEDCIAEDGTDYRNYYGNPQVLIEARRLFAPILSAMLSVVWIVNRSKG